MAAQNRNKLDIIATNVFATSYLFKFNKMRVKNSPVASQEEPTEVRHVAVGFHGPHAPLRLAVSIASGSGS